jgi:HD superfamily phosphohydrolase YqeK
VAELLGGWAEARGLPEEDRIRWRAAGHLHDALRQAEADELTFWTERDWEPALLHGPACAERLREEGVEDEALLRAVAYHTLGHPELDDLGRHLYLADFLEPGRQILPDVRDRLRSLLPDEPLEVLLSVVALRIAHRLEVRGGIRRETVAFWNRLLEEADEDEDEDEAAGPEDGAEAGGPEDGAEAAGAGEEDAA